MGLPSAPPDPIYIPVGVIERYGKKEGHWNVFYIENGEFRLVNKIVKQAELEKFHTQLFAA